MTKVSFELRFEILFKRRVYLFVIIYSMKRLSKFRSKFIALFFTFFFLKCLIKKEKETHQ